MCAKKKLESTACDVAVMQMSLCHVRKGWKQLSPMAMFCYVSCEERLEAIVAHANVLLLRLENDSTGISTK